MEFVEIWNKNSGARISTYVILGERGSKCCVLNGAAARTCQPGDQLIICNSAYVEVAEVAALKPKILMFDSANNVTQKLSYSVSIGGDNCYQFEILDDAGNPLPIPLAVSNR